MKFNLLVAIYKWFCKFELRGSGCNMESGHVGGEGRDLTMALRLLCPKRTMARPRAQSQSTTLVLASRAKRVRTPSTVRSCINTGLHV